MPGSLFSRYSPVPGRSVPLSWVTRYCSGDSREIASGVLRYSVIFLIPRDLLGYRALVCRERPLSEFLDQSLCCRRIADFGPGDEIGEDVAAFGPGPKLPLISR